MTSSHHLWHVNFFVLVAAAFLHVSAAGQAEADPSLPSARACAVRDVQAITVIEDRGAAGDVPSEKLAEAGLTLMQARRACDEGRIPEALALYDGILRLGAAISVQAR